MNIRNVMRYEILRPIATPTIEINILRTALAQSILAIRNYIRTPKESTNVHRYGALTGKYEVLVSVVNTITLIHNNRLCILRQ